MISDNQKIAFLEYDVLKLLEMNPPGWSEQFKEWFEKARNLIWGFKQALINKESDEQERQWRESMD